MRIVSALCVIMLFVLPRVTAQEKPASEETKPAATAEFFDRKYDPSANPFRQLDVAKEQAAQESKRILLDVGGEWCIWCHRLDDLFRANKDLADLVNKHYVIMKVNVSMDNKNEIFMAQYPKVAGYPHLFILDADGKMVHSQDSGQLEEGKGHSREKVAEFLKKWAKKN
ncbi:MAG: thioredoxin family protein [Bacteroidetes bacterium]|jgi:thiol:disulfide interchange protein|nr:thioredoxin family protein [Bacteroidota bacterium]